jgi:hypothetical protein
MLYVPVTFRLEFHMTEVNINNPPPEGVVNPPSERVVVSPPERVVVTPPERVIVERDTTDRTSAATINFLTVLLVLVAIVAILWFLFTGPLQAAMYPAPPTNINVTPRP